MENFDYRSARTYAGQYGAIIGLIWICSFACFIGGLHYPVLSNFSLLIGLASLFITIKLLNRFGRTVFPLKFSQATWMAILVYMYASLLFAAAQYIYFRFIDNGFWSLHWHYGSKTSSNLAVITYKPRYCWEGPCHSRQTKTLVSPMVVVQEKDSNPPLASKKSLIL